MRRAQPLLSILPGIDRFAGIMRGVMILQAIVVLLQSARLD